MLLGNVFTLAVGLPLQMYVSRVLGPDGLGVFGLMEAATVTIAGLLSLGIAPAIVRFVPAHLARQEFASVRIIIRLGGGILIAAGGAAYLTLLIVVKWGGGGVWPFIAEHRAAIAMMGLTIPLGLILFFLQQSLRGFQEIRYIVVGSSFVQLLVKATATIGAFAVGLRLEGYILAVVLAMSVAVVWMAYGLRKKLHALPARPEAAKAPSYGAWRRFAAIVYANSLAATLSGRLDRFILGYFFGSGAVGILVVAYQLQQLPGQFLQMLLVVGAPMFSAAHSRNDRPQRQHLYTLMTDWVVRASLPLILFLFVFAHPLLSLYGPEFADRGVAILWILTAGQLFGIGCGPIGQLAIMSGLEVANLRIGIACTVVNTILVIAVVPVFGLLGVACVSAFHSLLVSLLVLFLIRRRLGVVWWNSRYLNWLLPGALTLSLGLAVILSDVDLGAVALAATLVAMYAVFAGVSLLRGLHDDDKELLDHLVSRLVRRAPS